ncbi:Holliday junction resolvase RuvX [Dokdonella sp.]|uniref:Holliday junction resolvase RuvX n=1 Tax=Dokdonella sp. TaxID=2291710 RepID=UPI001B292D75|nr:Holliday junction resolvase RuvX [Dokdonella sp.]MBO9665136.1 Holliday junction resolvase RuvX [Dokdonella sp.]
MPATPENPDAASNAGFATGNILAFDVGSRLIGVALGNRLTAGARALAAVANGDWPRLDALVAEWRPDRFVVGLPLALDGGEQPMTRVAREFARALERRHARPVELVDERHSSREAAHRFAERRASGAAKRKHAADIDSLAAAIILERWLADGASSITTPATS